MNSSSTARPPNPLSALRRFTRPRAEAAEVCEFCSVPLGPRHRHLLEGATRKIICACDACALRFDNVIGRYKLLPRDSLRLSAFQLSDTQWESFSLPIALAFFFHSTAAGKVIAMYPSPAGAVESLLPLESWQELVSANPDLARLKPDVEALLVNRVAAARDYFIAPIDVCYELVGLIRTQWRGLSGGDNVWPAVAQFFAHLGQETQPPNLREHDHA